MKLLKYNSKDWQELSKQRQEEILTNNFDLPLNIFKDNLVFYILDSEFRSNDKNNTLVIVTFCIFVKSISSWFISNITENVYVENVHLFNDKNNSLYRRDVVQRVIQNVFTNI